ncbi:MAG TPA: hypothetical protein VHX59_03315 [Mycobacteriales bacterium]|jgi:hypothetical protein|nr:hypothetical protein [Mycobacteriales bacterium]
MNVRTAVSTGRAAGVLFALAWLVGLFVWTSNTVVSASDATIVRDYAAGSAPAMAQSTLVHGVAGLALAGVVLAALRLLPRDGWARAAGIAGAAAVAISLVQWVLGMLLAGWAAPAGAAARSGDLFEVINRLDGVKMLALAALAVAGAGAIRGGRALPTWLAWLGWVLAAALVVSGIGYLFLVGALSGAAYVSLPLLLLWVTGVGVTLGRSKSLVAS